MSIDHGSADILVSEEFLDGTNVMAGLKKVRGKGVPKGRLRADDEEIHEGRYDSS